MEWLSVKGVIITQFNLDTYDKIEVLPPFKISRAVCSIGFRGCKVSRLWNIGEP